MAAELLSTEKTIDTRLVSVFKTEHFRVREEEDTEVSLKKKYFQLFIKRAFDITLSCLLILFFSPVFRKAAEAK